MTISYDKEIDAKYISVKKGKVFETKPYAEDVFIDLNEKGEILGIEILNASQNLIGFQTQNEQYQVIEIDVPQQPHNQSYTQIGNMGFKVPQIAQTVGV